MDEHSRRGMGLPSVPVTGLGSCSKSRLDGWECRIQLVTVKSITICSRARSFKSVKQLYMA